MSITRCAVDGPSRLRRADPQPLVRLLRPELPARRVGTGAIDADAWLSLDHGPAGRADRPPVEVIGGIDELLEVHLPGEARSAEVSQGQPRPAEVSRGPPRSAEVARGAPGSHRAAAG